MMKLLYMINRGIASQQVRSIFRTTFYHGRGARSESRSPFGSTSLAQSKKKIAALVMLVAATGASISYSLCYYPEKKNPTVIFILGGPGSGKGTQGSKLAKDFSAVHLSAGELLRRAQQDLSSEYSELIEKTIKLGQIVPHQITISLLKKEIDKNPNGIFIIDGFPREMNQALKFEEEVCKCSMVLFYECPEEVMTERLMERAKCSNRVDDNIQSIKLRFKTYREATLPVIEHYGKLGLVREVSCVGTMDDVYKNTVEACNDIFEMHKNQHL